MLVTIDNLFGEDECESIYQHLLKAQWQDGKHTAGGLAATVKNNLQLDDKGDIAVTLREVLLEKLAVHPQFISAALPRKIFPPKFNCYQHGGHYGLHVDNALLTLPNNEFMRSDISATVFFSPADSYDGGELMIETQYGAQAVKLDAGSAVLYPSTSLHEVLPVTRGKRLCSFFWVQSLVANQQLREQLYELDQAIQALTAERGENDIQVRNLSGVYHNLLRAVAEC